VDGDLGVGRRRRITLALWMVPWVTHFGSFACGRKGAGVMPGSGSEATSSITASLLRDEFTHE